MQTTTIEATAEPANDGEVLAGDFGGASEDDGDAEREADEPGGPESTQIGRAAGGVAEANKRLRRIVGQRCTDARNLCGLGQTEAARQLGDANGTQLSLIEQGRRLPPYSRLLRLAALYGVSTDFLLGRHDDPESDGRSSQRRWLLQSITGFLSRNAEAVITVAEAHANAVPAHNAARSVLRRMDDLNSAFASFERLNAEAWVDVRGGALVVRCAKELAEAASELRAALDRHDRELDFALHGAQAAASAAGCAASLANSENSVTPRQPLNAGCEA